MKLLILARHRGLLRCVEGRRQRCSVLQVLIPRLFSCFPARNRRGHLWCRRARENEPLFVRRCAQLAPRFVDSLAVQRLVKRSENLRGVRLECLRGGRHVADHAHLLMLDALLGLLKDLDVL